MFQIAVVDDDQDSRHMICDFLDFHGYRYSDFSSACDFLDHHRDKSSRKLPHLVVSDVNMPNIDGFTLSEILKNEFPEIPIILVTAMPSEQDSVRASKLGVSSYLTKPFELKVFQDSISKALVM